MSALVVLDSVVITVVAGKCAGCGAARMIFINHGGRTQCAGCAAKDAK